MTIEDKVASLYGLGGLGERILTALANTAADPDHPTLEELAPVDEFHIGGRPATDHFATQLDFASDHRLLDVGCGIGGTARYVTGHGWGQVTGVDITPYNAHRADSNAREQEVWPAVRFNIAAPCAAMTTPTMRGSQGFWPVRTIRCAPWRSAP